MNCKRKMLQNLIKVTVQNVGLQGFEDKKLHMIG